MMRKTGVSARHPLASQSRPLVPPPRCGRSAPLRAPGPPPCAPAPAPTPADNKCVRGSVCVPGFSSGFFGWAGWVRQWSASARGSNWLCTCMCALLCTSMFLAQRPLAERRASRTLSTTLLIMRMLSATAVSVTWRSGEGKKTAFLAKRLAGRLSGPLGEELEGALPLFRD